MSKNIYHIPVDLIKFQTFKIEAENQRDAIDQLTAFLKEHKATNNMFSEFKVRETEIDCDQDEEMIDNVVEDFNLEIKELSDRESATHHILPGWGAGFPKIKNEE